MERSYHDEKHPITETVSHPLLAFQLSSCLFLSARPPFRTHNDIALSIKVKWYALTGKNKVDMSESGKQTSFQIPTIEGAAFQISQTLAIHCREHLITDGKKEQVALYWQRRLSKLTRFYGRLAQTSEWQQVVSKFLKRRSTLACGLFGETDPRGNLFTELSSYLYDDTMRRAFLEDIDTVSLIETEELLEQARSHNATLEGFDVVIIGGAGLHGSIASTELRTYFPEINMLSVDENDHRGGNFRSFLGKNKEEVPVFQINSRHNLPIRPHLHNYPDGPENLNDTQPHAPAHLTAIDAEAYPSQNKLAAVVATNSYLACPSLQGARAVSIHTLHNHHGNHPRNIITVNVRGEIFTIPTSFVLITTGSGKPYIPSLADSVTTQAIIEKNQRKLESYLSGASDEIPQVVTGCDFLCMVAARKGDVFQSLAGKNVTVVGIKGTAQSVLKLLTGHARKEAYEGYVTQDGRVRRIAWIGRQKFTREQFVFRPQNEVLRAELPQVPDSPSTLIQSLRGRMVGLAESEDEPERIGVLIDRFDETDPEKTRLEYAHLVIPCTGYTNEQLASLLQAIHPGYSFVDIVDAEQEHILGRQVNSSIYIVGPAANIPASEKERRENPGRATFQNSMRRLGPRTRAIARYLVNQLTHSV